MTWVGVTRGKILGKEEGHTKGITTVKTISQHFIQQPVGFMPFPSLQASPDSRYVEKGKTLKHKFLILLFKFTDTECALFSLKTVHEGNESFVFTRVLLLFSSFTYRGLHMLL